jgi:signal transduction histidine kinase
MEKKIKSRLHLINLIIKHENDIPKVRTKVKIIANCMGFDRFRIVQLATSASEITRFMVQNFQNSKLEINFIQIKNAGIQMLFTASGQKKLDMLSKNDYEFNITILNNFFDFLEIEKSPDENKLSINCITQLKDSLWDELIAKEEEIRNLCFKDMEEYYLENLKQKHSEVLRLLKETANKNLELDKMNSQLWQLTSDMEMLAQERTITELTLKVADKIRNPITVIGGTAIRLIKSECLSESEKKKISAIVKEIEKLELIVKEFDELSMGKSRFFEKENLQDIVEESYNEALMVLTQQIAKKNISINLIKEEKPLHFITNKRTFKLAFLHVLRNAVYAAHSEGKITIKTGFSENNSFVEITDNGPGIPDEILAKLFKETISTKPTGTGLGLILVKRILQEHQGDIEIETSKDKGTTVRLVFPLRWKEAGK